MVAFSEMLLVCQMRYYDAMEDSNCKGFIDLAEVESVQPVKSMPGAPKKADENSFIEVTLPITLLRTPTPHSHHSSGTFLCLGMGVVS